MYMHLVQLLSLWATLWLSWLTATTASFLHWQVKELVSKHAQLLSVLLASQSVKTGDLSTKGDSDFGNSTGGKLQLFHASGWLCRP